MQLKAIENNDIKISLNGRIISNTESRIEGRRLIVKFLKPEFSYNELAQNIENWVFKAYSNKVEIELMQMIAHFGSDESGFFIEVEFENKKKFIN